jgi:hypothetical protein
VTEGKIASQLAPDAQKQEQQQGEHLSQGMVY